MPDVRDFLRASGLPAGDLNELPGSPGRFGDGAQYRVEIPSTEGPRCLAAVLEEADRLDVRVHRVSQGSGVFLHTDSELGASRRPRASTPPLRRPLTARSRSSRTSRTACARRSTGSARC